MAEGPRPGHGTNPQPRWVTGRWQRGTGSLQAPRDPYIRFKEARQLGEKEGSHHTGAGGYNAVMHLRGAPEQTEFNFVNRNV